MTMQFIEKKTSKIIIFEITKKSHFFRRKNNGKCLRFYFEFDVDEMMVIHSDLSCFTAFFIVCTQSRRRRVSPR